MRVIRLPEGGHIDRGRPIEFYWDDRRLTGFAGDTLAAALLANDCRVVGRSFKYHRPRGVQSAGVEESGALVTLGVGARRDPNVRATTQPLFAGLRAYGQNAWPNVRFDVGAAGGLLGRFIPAGFYYKTFMGLPPFETGKGTGFWMFYERLIRRAAGFGRAADGPDPDAYEHAYGHCDLLVVGSGPAGLAAASAAAAQGLDVLLVEQDFRLGGQLLNRPAPDMQHRRLLAELTALGVRVMRRTTAFGLYDHGVVGLLERVADEPEGSPRERCWQVSARHILLATGAIEQHLLFGDNDRPGVMLASACRAYLNRFALRLGERVVVATNNDSVYSGAAELAASGAHVRVLDARPELPPSLLALAGAAGFDIQCNAAPLKAHGARGVSGVTLATRHGANWRRSGRLPCDALLVSGGWMPVVHLLSQRGVKPVWDARQQCFMPPESFAEPVSVAGSAAAVWRSRDCELSGRAAGLAAAHRLGRKVSVPTAPAPGGWQCAPAPVNEIADAGKHKAWVDFQSDVTCADLALARREGFIDVEHLKRYTTLGMATDGGKVGNVPGLKWLAEATGSDPGAVGTTTYRPPYTPVSLGALAGRHTGEFFRVLRRTPLHDWNLAAGAKMQAAGLWQRPWYFPQDGEDLEAAYCREAACVRETVGLCDVTSLGKIAVQGPDALELLQRLCVNDLATLQIGRARYWVMLRVDGCVLDDGTVWRMDEHDYFMTTTTAHAAEVMHWMEECLQLHWPELRAAVTSVTDQWAGLAVAGPQAREALAAVLAPGASEVAELPFMGVCETTACGIPCRIARISFSGELGYEIYVPSDFGEALAENLWQAARDLGGCLYGLEALGTLRIEKGHVTGAELDGRVTLEDAGLGRMAARGKPFIGSALRHRPALESPARPRLVGIRPVESGARFAAGALLTGGPVEPDPERWLAEAAEYVGDGWITAVTYSPAFGHWLGLGFIRGGAAAWDGRAVTAVDPVRGRSTSVEIIPPHMFDPQGERMR